MRHQRSAAQCSSRRAHANPSLGLGQRLSGFRGRSLASPEVQTFGRCQNTAESFTSIRFAGFDVAVDNLHCMHGSQSIRNLRAKNESPQSPADVHQGCAAGGFARVSPSRELHDQGRHRHPAGDPPREWSCTGMLHLIGQAGLHAVKAGQRLLSAACSFVRILIATRRPMESFTAPYTEPIPPAPTRRVTR